MAYEHQPGKGTMFRNDSTNPKAPLWSGQIKIPEDAAGKTMQIAAWYNESYTCLLYTSPSPRDRSLSRMPSSA